jgi:hypothetical protein
MVRSASNMMINNAGMNLGPRPRPLLAGQRVGGGGFRRTGGMKPGTHAGLWPEQAALPTPLPTPAAAREA